jgi:hypothetical protein
VIGLKACKDPHFAFTRYAESLASSASSFDDLYTQLQSDQSLTKAYIHRCLNNYCHNGIPDLLVISLPFPGNVLGGLLTAQWFKKNHPQTQIAIGGGYVNTELRRVSDERLFEFIDYICLDDGEKPLQNILEYLQGSTAPGSIKKVFCIQAWRHPVHQWRCRKRCGPKRHWHT